GRALAIPTQVKAAFEIFIQLGAILAVVVYFIRDLGELFQRARRDPAPRRLLVNVGVAFAPAAVIGVLLGDWIEANLFSPTTVALALIAGGVVLLLVESRQVPAARTNCVEQVTIRQALGVGIAQIASLFPGVSRSGATLVGGLLAGLDRPTALRFSFYLSIPTMGAASTYSLLKALDRIPPDWWLAFGVGVVTSFVVALLVVKLFLSYVARHDLRPFGWYRIGAGVVILGLVSVGWLSG
ncbi:MAG: undecaprenyl-diphosphate phosphatase, partial [Thermoflexales bacterium]|nr:undecaprenyl-diphosphate phosphatase [Thermoflexales bacterium]